MTDYPNRQNNPAAAIPVYIVAGNPFAGASHKNYAANTAGNLVKAGQGVFYGLTINTAGVGSTATIYDGPDTGGVKIGTYSTTAQGAVALPPGFTFTSGLFVVLAGGTPADVTIAYA